MTPRHTEDDRAQHCGSCIPVQGVIGTSLDTISLEALACNAHAMLCTCFAQKRARQEWRVHVGVVGVRGVGAKQQRRAGCWGHFLGGTRRIVVGVAVDAFV